MTEQPHKQVLSTQNQNTKEEEAKKPKKWWHWCCCIPALLFVLAIVAMTVLVFISDKKQADRMSKRNKPETYSEMFNTNFLPDYTVNATDEEKINKKIIDLLQKNSSEIGDYTESGDTKLLRLLNTDEKNTAAKSGMKFLKDNYPEGYYLVVNSVLKTPEKDQQFPNFFLRSADEEQRVGIVVHELSHLGRLVHSGVSRSGYVIEDKFITLDSQPSLPPGDELLKYIGVQTSFDKIYLSDGKQDIYTTLDEVISHTKSLRVDRAYVYYKKGKINENYLQGLSRQLYFLSLHLKNIKENHPDDWQKLKKDKEFTYLIARQTAIAKTELQVAKDEGASGSSGGDFASTTDKNLALMSENQTLFEELFAATGINAMGNLQNTSQKEITGLGLTIEKF